MQFIKKRIFDIFWGVILAVILSPILVIIALVVKLTSPGSVIYWSKRVGKNGRLFKMPKFRSMKIDAPALASHLLKNPDAFLTSAGKFLRRTSLDELPQLWCILKGEMSFVGPRPALFNQYDLIALRKSKGVDCLLPGLTGLAQINGRDELSVQKKVVFDIDYMKKQSFLFDLKIIGITIVKVMRRDGVSH